MFGLRKEPVVDNEEEPWSKKAHDHDVVCALSYVESDILPIGTQLDIDCYNVTGAVSYTHLTLPTSAIV